MTNGVGHFRDRKFYHVAVHESSEEFLWPDVAWINIIIASIQ